MLAATVVAVMFGGVLSFAQAEGTSPAATKEAPVVAPAPVASSYTENIVQGDDFDKWCESMKKPCDWFQWGADFQYRAVYQGNNRTLNRQSEDSLGIGNNELAYDRSRGRIWTTIMPTENIELNSRFMWSWFDFWEPESSEGTTTSHGEFDQLNVNLKNFLGDKSSLKIGRQDILIGEGWLTGEGTPLDGSLSGYFDAIRYQYEFEDAVNTADLAYIYNTANQNTWLHPINAPGAPMYNTEQDEQGVIAYFTNKSVENTEISPYLMYKKATDNDGVARAYNAELYTPGLRVAHTVDENWKWRAEGAYQFGRSDKGGDGMADVSAFGANTALQYFMNDEMKNNFRMQYEFLSGNRPSTGDYEGFDVLWGRWARFSNIYADAVRVDSRAGDYTNLHRVGPGWSVSPTDKATIATDYFLLFADQAQDGASGSSDSGLFRGQLVSSALTYKFNKHISGELVGELYFPGNYYSDGNNDTASYLRSQVVLTF
jgi:hypothetical protein